MSFACLSKRLSENHSISSNVFQKTLGFSLLRPNATGIPKGLNLCPACCNEARTLTSPATHQSLQFRYLQHLLDLPLQKLLDGTPAPK